MTDLQQLAQGLLRPCSVAPHALGKNISPNNPDVEILAMILKDMPVSGNGFEALDRGSRGWVLTSYCVLGVGPPGFSSVPYMSGKKSTAEGKRLYEYDANGATKIYSFEVGKTNKDRGVRSEYADIDGNSTNISVVLKPGMCLNDFMRPDFMQKISMEDMPESGIVPAFSLVWIQVGSANVEQAVKGRLLKMKRMKIISAKEKNACLFNTYQLPSTESDFRMANDVNMHISLRESIDTRSNCMYLNRFVGRNAYIVQDDAGGEQDFLLVDVDKELQVAHLHMQTLSSVLPSASAEEKRKFFNLAICTGAVSVVVRSKPVDAVVLTGETDAFRARVVSVTINYNTMLGLDLLEKTLQNSTPSQQGEGKCVYDADTDAIKFYKGEDFVLWTLNRVVWPHTRKQIHYVLQTKPTIDDVHEAESWAFIDKSAPGKHHQLKITMLEERFEETLNAYQDNIEELPCVMSLQMRPENRNMAGILGKRQRPELEFEC